MLENTLLLASGGDTSGAVTTMRGKPGSEVLVSDVRQVKHTRQGGLIISQTRRPRFLTAIRTQSKHPSTGGPAPTD